MPAGGRRRAPFEHSLVIAATPPRVLAAFFDPGALRTWWQVVRSVTVPRPLGVYAVEWEPTPYRDEVLGPLGGVMYGTVLEWMPGREFFVGGLYWIPPEGDPLGPMALEVSCRIDGPSSRVRVRQSGAEEGPRWRRYFDVIGAGWPDSLASLKTYLEGEPA